MKLDLRRPRGSHGARPLNGAGPLQGPRRSRLRAMILGALARARGLPGSGMINAASLRIATPVRAAVPARSGAPGGQRTPRRLR